jgi:hypothetical protein
MDPMGAVVLIEGHAMNEDISALNFAGAEVTIEVDEVRNYIA